MKAYFEPEQAFSISMPQPVFKISIAYKKKTCSYKVNDAKTLKIKTVIIAVPLDALRLQIIHVESFN